MTFFLKKKAMAVWSWLSVQHFFSPSFYSSKDTRIVSEDGFDSIELLQFWLRCKSQMHSGRAAKTGQTPAFPSKGGASFWGEVVYLTQSCADWMQRQTNAVEKFALSTKCNLHHWNFSFNPSR